MRPDELLNIFINGTEISSVVFGILLILETIPCLLVRQWRMAGKFTLAGVLLGAYGLSVSSIVDGILFVAGMAQNFVSLSNEQMLAAIAHAGIALLVIQLIACFYLPAIIAIKRNANYNALIFYTNISAAFIPLVWNTLLLYAVINEPKQKQVSANSPKALA